MAVKGIYTVPISATFAEQNVPFNTSALFVCLDDDTFDKITSYKGGINNWYRAKGRFGNYNTTTQSGGGFSEPYDIWDTTFCPTLNDALTVVDDVFGERFSVNTVLSAGNVSEILTHQFDAISGLANPSLCVNAQQCSEIISTFCPILSDTHVPYLGPGGTARVNAKILDKNVSNFFAEGSKNYNSFNSTSYTTGTTFFMYKSNTYDNNTVNGVTCSFDRLQLKTTIADAQVHLQPELYFSGFTFILSFCIIKSSMIVDDTLNIPNTYPPYMYIQVSMNSVNEKNALGQSVFVDTNNYSCAVGYYTQYKNILEPFNGKGVVEVDSDPFQRGGKDGESGAGGGGGGGDNKSDQHPVPTPPTVSISDTGYFTIYNPTQVQMKQLSAKLWDGDFDLSNIKSLMSSPIENILSLAYVPLPVSGATAVTAKIGGADMGVTVNKIDKHFFQLDLGTVAIKEYYGSYLDYYPHTVVYIFLPYIGIISLDTNEVMGKTLRLVYNYDVVTGSVIAYISTNGLNSKLYEYNGNCIYNLPVTGRDFSTIISGALGLASSAVGAVVTHGASIPFSVGTVGQSLIDTQLPNYKHSGDVGGSPAIMDDRQPCVIIIRPRKINSKHQPKYTGYGSLITKKLSNVSGFTMVNDIRLNGISGATDIEIEEIRTMLKEGVVF